jgi:hypothetical protein
MHNEILNIHKPYEDTNGDDCPRHIVRPCSWCSWNFPENTWMFIRNYEQSPALHRINGGTSPFKTYKNHTGWVGNSYETTISHKNNLKPPLTVDTGANFLLRWWLNHHQPPTLFRWKESKSKITVQKSGAKTYQAMWGKWWSNSWISLQILYS